MKRGTSSFRDRLKRRMPDYLRALTRLARSPGSLWKKRSDLPTVTRFVLSRRIESLVTRLSLLKSFYTTTSFVACPHTETDIIDFVSCILLLPASIDGCIVEAGCYKGGSTAKFSLAAQRAGRELVVFDSFQGLPPNAEDHASTIFGETPDFTEGKHKGTVDEVTANIARFGSIESCSLVEGWFDQTMPSFDRPVAAAYLDVDLAASTKTCLKHLYPLLQVGGYFFPKMVTCRELSRCSGVGISG